MTRAEILEIAKPILFNTDMVRATLDGRKRVIRRVVKPPYFVDGNENDPRTLQVLRTASKGSRIYRAIGRMPYPADKYNIGDYLYVRETWCEFPRKSFHYRADYNTDRDREFSECVVDPKWRPSLHMPKEAARIFLRVTDVRVERLHAMTLYDFQEEWLQLLRPEAFNDPENAYLQVREIFSSIWDSTISKKDLNQYGWSANPWVWVIEFERVEV